MLQSIERRIQFAITSALVLMTLSVTPWLNLDPINLVKFFFLVVGAISILGLLFSQRQIVFRNEWRIPLVAVAFFILSLLIVLVVHGASEITQIFGTFGRNTGFLAYLSLSLMFLFCVLVSNSNFVHRTLVVLTLLGAFNAVYGLLQWFGFDPINWVNPYNPIVGTLGNPNFVSAFLGISALACLSFVLQPQGSLRVKTFMIFNAATSLVVVFLSDSSQGLLIFAIGTALILYFWKLHPSSLRFLKFAYWSTFTAIGGLSVLGLLNRGPLSNLLYQDSVTYRGDYWRAGWNMTIQNPLFGVGLDSYGDWYRLYRTEEAALRRGPDITSNSAHNVFLDISSNGGFLLLFSYLLVISLVLRSSVKILRNSTGFDFIGVALVVCWLAYLIQSTISINQLGLAIWGWVLGGLIVGYEIRMRDSEDAPKGKLAAKKLQVPPAAALSGALGLFLGVLIAIWPISKDANFKNALQSGDAAVVNRVSGSFPADSYYFVYASQILAQNKIDDLSLNLAREATKANPRDFNAWKALILNPKISDSEKADAIEKMKALDPHNNTLGD